MTEKEYEEAIATQNAIIHSHEKEIRVARSKKGEVTEVFCQSLSERYADFIGKKVKVEFNGYKPVVGFLMKFKRRVVVRRYIQLLQRSRKMVLPALIVTWITKCQVTNSYQILKS